MKQIITEKPRKRRFWRRLLLGAIALYLVLLIPDAEPPLPRTAGKQPFLWNEDAVWSSLNDQFKAARADGCPALSLRIDAALAEANQLLDSIESAALTPQDTKFSQLETNLFQLAPMIAVCLKRLPEYAQVVSRTRFVVKNQSRSWDINSAEARHRLYRMLYGGRAALEEVMMQMPVNEIPALIQGHDERSQAPSSNLLGVTIHSGDVLVSRGGSPNSALIARGHDYPGNFSHVALVHVDNKTRRVSIIESHIEKGVTVASVEDYLADTKLRVMVLRLRSDLPQLKTDPLLPHRAASRALQEAESRHIPYDFTMDANDRTKLFCSEVVSSAYEPFGINLWIGKSSISSPGIAAWLATFGARQFETEEPSDLVYDPQMRVVAEWREPSRLYKDHTDNAVIDAMLEGANTGDRLGYPRYMLPAGRLAKAYSVVLNASEKVGPVPEGMKATAALRNKAFVRRHATIKARLLMLADQFKARQGYIPPYWELVKQARQARHEVE